MGEFLFELDPEPLEQTLTCYGGIAYLIRAPRSLDLDATIIEAGKGRPTRLIGIRGQRQGELFADGTQAKYFAVASNR